MIGIKLISIVLIGVIFNISCIYTYTIPKIDGGNKQMVTFQDKKILIITLPIVRTLPNDSILFRLDTLAAAHQNDLYVIGVPSFEDGFTPARKHELKTWYKSKLGNYITIADGLYTRRASGELQHPLFKWLTTLSINEVFDVDVSGPEFKFFINTEGVLYGVLSPQSNIGGSSVSRLIRM